MGFSSQIQTPIQATQNSSSGKGSPSTFATPSTPTPSGSSGKGSAPQQGMQGNVTYSGTSGQQQMGSPNPYPNTIGQWDNASIQPMQRSGKGKGF